MLRVIIISKKVGKEYFDKLNSPAPLYKNVRSMIRANYPTILKKTKMKLLLLFISALFIMACSKVPDEYGSGYTIECQPVYILQDKYTYPDTAYTHTDTFWYSGRIKENYTYCGKELEQWRVWQKEKESVPLGMICITYAPFRFFQKDRYVIGDIITYPKLYK
jgi:hypothetical protein